MWSGTLPTHCLQPPPPQPHRATMITEMSQARPGFVTHCRQAPRFHRGGRRHPRDGPVTLGGVRIHFPPWFNRSPKTRRPVGGTTDSRGRAQSSILASVDGVVPPTSSDQDAGRALRRRRSYGIAKPQRQPQRSSTRRPCLRNGQRDVEAPHILEVPQRTFSTKRRRRGAAWRVRRGGRADLVLNVVARRRGRTLPPDRNTNPGKHLRLDGQVGGFPVAPGEGFALRQHGCFAADFVGRVVTMRSHGSAHVPAALKLVLGRSARISRRAKPRSAAR